jgi:CO dehydrogenase maturation factor
MIAMTGKGGSGKTTLAGMFIRELIRTNRTPVLAIDADPNATLALTLGVEVPSTIGDLRNRMGDAAMEVSEIPKERLMDQWLGEMLTEEIGFDLLTMGQPEGPKCYCYVNNLLRRYLKMLRGNYAYVVVDCEAGMEHLSRLTIDDVDTLLIVAEPTGVGLATAKRISNIVDSLPIKVDHRVLVINKIVDSTTPDISEINVDAVQCIPFDHDLADRSSRGEPIDDSAGDEMRKTIASLVNLCLAPQRGRQKTAATIKQP